MMGGIGAHEYMAPCAAGENEVALVGRRLRRQRGDRQRRPAARRGLPEPLDAPERVETPGRDHDRGASRGCLGIPAGATIKAFPVIVEGAGSLLVVVRGDHRLNEIKLQNALGARLRARPPRRRCATSSAPCGLHRPGRRARRGAGSTRPLRGRAASWRAATEPDIHLRGVEPGRDFEPERADVRTVEAGDATRTGRRSASSRRSRWANIFKLGTRYSEPARRHLPRRAGRGAADLDGLLRHRPGAHRSPPRSSSSPTSAGISWPRSLAPFDVELVTLGKAGASRARELAERLYEELRARGPRRAATTTATLARREVRRRRAARLPAAPHRGQARAGGRRARGAGAPRAREAHRCRSREPRRRPRSCGATLAVSPADGAPPARPRPLAARRRPRRSPARRSTPGRSRTRSASCASR